MNQSHVKRIVAILELLAREEGLTPARAALACEDARVALEMGFVLGLDLQEVHEQAVETVTSIMEEQVRKN